MIKFAFLVFALLPLAFLQENSERAVVKELFVPAPVEDVWLAWTTPEGITTFFAPACNVELRVGGPYEILFYPDNPPGWRGAEDLKVLDFREGEMLSIEWNSPPQWPEVRKIKTCVVIELELAEGGTKLTMTHDGWREGKDWNEVFEYFQGAWDDVLGRLVQRFESGPIDWSTAYSQDK